MFLTLSSRAVCLGLLGLVLSACLDDSGPGSPDAGAHGWQQDLCPPADHPEVHYVSMDPSACAERTLECTEDQTGFDNACGCGCVDKGDPICPDFFDPNVTWESHDPDECDGEPRCRLGDTPFSNSCGCGCISY